MIPLISATVFLIYMNAPVVLVKVHGLPQLTLLSVPILLAIPMAYRVLICGEVVRFPGLIIVGVLMLACHSVSAMASINPLLGMERVFSWLLEGVLLAFLMVNVLRTRREVFVATSAVVAAGALMGMLALLQQALGATEYQMWGFGQLEPRQLEAARPRLAGPVGEKNRFAQILAVLIPVSAGLAMTAPARWRWLYCIAVLLIFGGIALTYSRGAVVGLVLVAPLALIFGFLRLRHIAFTTAFIAILLVALPHFAKRVESIGEVAAHSLGLSPGGFRGTDGATRGRVTEMQAAGLLFLDYPLLGAGPGMAPQYYTEYAALVGGKVRGRTRRTHNLYVQLAAETGVIGLLAFSAVLLAVLLPLDATRRWAQHHDRELWGLVCGLELGVFILMTTSLFLHAAYIRYFWFLLALAIAAASLPRELPLLKLSPSSVHNPRVRPGRPASLAKSSRA